MSLLPYARGSIDALMDGRTHVDVAALVEGDLTTLEGHTGTRHICGVTPFVIDEAGRLGVVGKDQLRLWTPPDGPERMARPGTYAIMVGAARATVYVAIVMAAPQEVGQSWVPTPPAPSTQDADVMWVDIRWVGDHLSDDESAVALQAVALSNWHTRTLYCARCGGRVQVARAGWTTHCPQCGVTEFPRQDPTVMVGLLDDEERILLARNAQWRPDFWSLTAGFVEAGEAPELAVRREVYEETALRVGEMRFWDAQPWPFPRSTMLGYFAHLAPDSARVPVPDMVEVTDARFFSRQELKEQVRSGQLETPAGCALARFMLNAWLGEELDPARANLM